MFLRRYYFITDKNIFHYTTKNIYSLFDKKAIKNEVQTDLVFTYIVSGGYTVGGYAKKYIGNF